MSRQPNQSLVPFPFFVLFKLAINAHKSGNSITMSQIVFNCSLEREFFLNNTTIAVQKFLVKKLINLFTFIINLLFNSNCRLRGLRKLIFRFIGEEGASGEGGSPYEASTQLPTWIIDPVDGTTNFVHGYPQVTQLKIKLPRIVLNH